MSPFEYLGVGDDADERAIKRAYAALLRRTRPEDDPQGFQALHEAYQAALHDCRRGDAAEPMQAAAAAAETAVPLPAPAAAPMIEPTAPARAARAEAEPAPPPLDPQRLLDELVAQAQALPVEEIERNLYARPEFLSLATKETAGRAVITGLFDRQPPMPGDVFDAVLDFFNHASVDTAFDPLALASLRTRMNLRWELLAHDRADFVARHHRVHGVRADVPEFTPGMRRRLAAPWRGARAWLAALVPGMVGRVSQFINALDGGRTSRLPPELDRNAVRFWLAAAESASWTASALRAIRTLAIAALLLLAMHNTPDEMRPLLGLGVWACGGHLALVAWRLLRRWLIQPEAREERWRIARLLFLPAMASLPPLLARFVTPAAAVVASAFMLTLAMSRLRMRLGLPAVDVWKLGISVLYGVMIMVVIVAPLVSAQPYAGSAAILIVWAADLWKQRRALREVWRRDARADLRNAPR